MKTIQKMMLAAGVAAVLGLAPPAGAEGLAVASTFGVVDMSKVLQVTEAAKSIFSQLEGKRKEYQAQISKEEDGLRSAEQEIVKQKDTLSKDAFEKKRKEFEEKVMNGQKLVQERKQTLDQAFNASMRNLRGEAAKVVAEVAKEKNYTAVFTQDAVMLSIPELDMTEVVIERLNKAVKKIPVDWSASAESASKNTIKK